MKAREALEWAALFVGVALLSVGALALVALYYISIVAALGAAMGAFVWAFRAVAGV